MKQLNNMHLLDGNIKMEFVMFMFNVMIAFAVGGVIYHFIERMFDNEV